MKEKKGDKQANPPPTPPPPPTLPPPPPPPEIQPEEDEGECEEWEAKDSESDSELAECFVEEIKTVSNWLEREPYLPKHLEEHIIITFLCDSGSVEETEAKLMNYFYARQSMKSVFRDRHPFSPNNLIKYDAVCVVPLTTGFDKKWIIFATWLTHENPQGFSIYHMMKLIFTELDILLQENRIRGKTVSVIMNLKGYSDEHLAKCTKYAAKKLSNLFTDCFPAKFNGFYIINAPENVSELTSHFGPLDFHIVENLEDLSGFLPIAFLTRDLGGDPKGPSCEELFYPFFNRLKEFGNWLAYEEFVRSKELALRMTTTRDEFEYKGGK